MNPIIRTAALAVFAMLCGVSTLNAQNSEMDRLRNNNGKPIPDMTFPIGEANTEYARYFTGDSYIYDYTVDGVYMDNVTFEPGCRNNWHIHHRTGQILICVGGEGWYQEWGKPAQRLRAGDVVNIPAEVKHWHGAVADSWFQHIAISVPVEGASNEWLEAVTNEEYEQLK